MITTSRRTGHTVLFFVCALVLLGFVIASAYVVGHEIAGVLAHIGKEVNADR
jgi:hypothetical protein